MWGLSRGFGIQEPLLAPPNLLDLALVKNIKVNI
ncbi:hypothetical protein Cycma_3163 [Cyclobacterium marinum DSM 745]|uniref:Uncharacterized protein n=1 Tax=Cyclobacterium marinum (strain ATCC 25205 / DSM 745 / LMG 13164 / NCIMB 1802) TaxID=880070 RepID=G0J700_CYCMS|nr:hypothetical protein Cycma_3163 [Cyclobacterium marinum DSM 745]